MQKLFKISNSFEPQIIGVAPQCNIIWPHDLDIDGDWSYRNIPVDGIISDDVLFPTFTAFQGAKMTDWVSQPALGTGFGLISSKLLDILAEVENDSMQTFLTKIQVLGKNVPYQIVYFPFDKKNLIFDWQLSEYDVYVTEVFTKKIVGIDPDIFLALKLFRRINITKAVLNWNLVPDIFKLRIIDSGIFVKEHIKEKIEQADITGIRFEEVPWL